MEGENWKIQIQKIFSHTPFDWIDKGFYEKGMKLST